MSDIFRSTQGNGTTGIAGRLKSKLYPTISRYFSRATLVEGKMKGANDTFRCLFIENSLLIKYITPRMYEDGPAIVKRHRIWIPMLKPILKTYSDSIDMCIAVLPTGYDPRFGTMVSFKGDMLIRSFINTSGTSDDVKKNFRHNKKQFYNRMETNPAFTCRISKDIKDFDLFYARMHIPHVQKRFQDLADLDPYEHMKNFFLKGFLLLIEEKGKTIAGVLCNVENDTLFFRRTGVLDGNDEYIKKGASSAQYYFTLKYALANGIPRVDLMRSRPFFDDGVFITKRKWGAEIYPDDEPRSNVFFFIPRVTSNVVKFFENNPLIVYRDNKMYGLIGRTNDNTWSSKDEKALHKKYYSPGLNGFIIIQPNSENPARVIDSMY